LPLPTAKIGAGFRFPHPGYLLATEGCPLVISGRQRNDMILEDKASLWGLDEGSAADSMATASKEMRTMCQLNFKVIAACMAMTCVAAFVGVAQAQDRNAADSGRLMESDRATSDIDTATNRSRTAQPSAVGIITTTSSNEGNRLRQPNAEPGSSPVGQVPR
jgi:hypothetical protein